MQKSIDDFLAVNGRDDILSRIPEFDQFAYSVMTERGKKHNEGSTLRDANTIPGIVPAETGFLVHSNECYKRLLSAIRRGAQSLELIDLTADCVNYLKMFGAENIIKQEGQNATTNTRRNNP